MRFEDRVFTVTGGASGIGEATVRKLASEGAMVVVADVDDERGAGVVAEVKRTGGTAAFAHIDVSQAADASAMVSFALSTYGRLDGSVNNAGVSQPALRLHETDQSLWQRLIAINLSGVFNCMRAELEHFLHIGGGVIVLL